MHRFSIKTQKVLTWLPIANIINFLLWGSNVRQMSPHEKKRGLLICFTTFIPFALLQICVTLLFPNRQPLYTNLVMYFLPAVLSWRLVRLQEQLQSKEKSASQPIKKSSKRIIVAIALAALVAIAVNVILQQTFSIHIEDQNGAFNTALSVLTKEDILSPDQCTIRNHTMKTFGSSSNVASEFKDVDAATVAHTMGNISGVYTVHATKVAAEALTLVISSTLSSGNMELAIVIDGEYHSNVAIDTIAQITLENVSGKTVLVRLAGESAKAEVSVTRSLIQ